MGALINGAIDTILFDLDGTLLPMDQDVFVKYYLGALGKAFAPKGYDPKAFAAAVMQGTGAMFQNDGTETNCSRFFDTFSALMGEDMRKLEGDFETFYRTDFLAARAATGEEPLCRKIVDVLKEKGYTLILATNPLFPAVATHERMTWNNIHPEDFELVTTYEEERFCKPNLDYYRSILSRFGKEPEQCMMIGNDVDEDMCATTLGMTGYLITNNILNRKNKPLEGFLYGTYEELYQFVQELPARR